MEYRPSGAEVPGIEKSFADWGLSQLQIQLLSQLPDSCSFVQDGGKIGGKSTEVGGLITADNLFGYTKTIVIRRGRTFNKQQGTWGGGQCVFFGFITSIPKTGTGSSESITYTAENPVWQLSRLVYQRTYATYKQAVYSLSPAPAGWTCDVNRGGPGGTLIPGNSCYMGDTGHTSHCTLGASYTGEPITFREQLEDILSWATTHGVNLKAGNILTHPDFSQGNGKWVPTEEVRDITCLEALQKQLRWAPTAVMSMDYSTVGDTQGLPTLHICRAKDLGAAPTLNVTGGAPVEAVSLTPRYDLQVSGVRIHWEWSSSTVSDRKLTVQWPLSIPNEQEIGVMTMTIALRGEERESAYVRTRRLPDDEGDHLLKKWIYERHPDLSPDGNGLVESIEIVPGSYYLDDDESWMDYELLEGQLFGWMDGGALWVRTTAHVQVIVYYTTGQTAGPQSVDLEFTATNIATHSSGQFKERVLSTEEDRIYNLEKRLYDELNALQLSGSVSLIEEECSFNYKPGQLLPFINGGAEWTNVLAPIQEVTLSIDEGSTTIKVGPNKRLSPGELVDLLRVNRARNNPWYPSFNKGESGEISSSSVHRKSTRGGGNRPAMVIDLPAVNNTPQEGKVVIKAYESISNQSTGAATGLPSVVMSAKTTDPKIEIKMADVYDLTNGNDPLVSSEDMRNVKIREIEVCDKDGNRYFVCGLFSGGYNKPT